MDLLRDNATKIENPYTIRNGEKSDFARKITILWYGVFSA